MQPLEVEGPAPGGPGGPGGPGTPELEDVEDVDLDLEDVEDVDLDLAGPKKEEDTTGLLSGEGGKAGHRGALPVSTVTRTAFNICGQIMGAGILSLPSTVAELGYVVGTSLLLVFSILVMYAGLLLARTKVRFEPEVTSYGTLMDKLHGPRFGRATSALMSFNWFANKSYFLVTLANCYAILAQELGGGACYWGLALAAAATCFPFMQIRTFHHISVLAAVGLLSIFVMLAFVFASLALHPPAGAGYRPGDLWPERMGFWKAWGSISNVVFAFQGQSIFFGEREDMRLRREAGED